MRLVATDLDGTIVRHDGTVSARTVAALRACQDAGVHVVFVTGRPPRWLRPVSDQTGHGGVVLCANGAIVYDLATDSVLRSRPLADDALRQVVGRLQQVLPQAGFAFETVDGLHRTPQYLPRWDPAGVPTAPLPDLLDGLRDQGVIKVLCRDETSTADPMLALAAPAVADLGLATHSNAADCLIEVSALGVGKDHALAELAAELGVPQADVVAFGDMPNDLGMLAWAGAGYAMADGHPDAVAVAAHRAPPHDEDGVAQVLEGLLSGLG